MSRQHTVPILLPYDGTTAVPLSPLNQMTGGAAVSEADIQELVHAHPGSLPISEIDPMFSDAVPICRELNTPAGPIDNLLITPSGLPVLVECKLWRNPEGRREVVGQILDYAKELSRWSSSDLQREVSVRLKQRGVNPLLDIVRASYPEVDEMEFNDALTLNLRRGRFLLLIVGDGIRAGVEAIAEYLQAHAGLHFSLGLVEMPIYVLPDGNRLVVPRVLAKTLVIARNVVAVPEGYTLVDEQEVAVGSRRSGSTTLGDERLRFWTELRAHLRFDDPEQVIQQPSRLGYDTFPLPAPGSHLSAYRTSRDRVGVFLSCAKDSPGEMIMQQLAADWDTFREELGPTARVIDNAGRPSIGDRRQVHSFEDPAEREQVLIWLAERLNTFANVLRPRVRSAMADLTGKD